MVKPQDIASEPDESRANETVGKSESNSLVDRFLNTGGGDSLDKIQNEYEVSKPVSLIIRGSQKLINESGTPAIADMVMGSLLYAVENRDTDSSNSNESEPESRTETLDVKLE
jgi:hypothetical protein